MVDVPDTSLLSPGDPEMAEAPLPHQSASVLQPIIDNAVETGLPAVIPPAIYVADGPLYLRSNLTLIFEAGATLRRNFATPFATLTQED